MTHETAARPDTAAVLAQVLAELLGGEPARLHAVLLELFTREGIGTKITPAR